MSVGTGTVELKITRRSGAVSVTSRSVRVCMSSRERRVSVLCRTYAFAKTWG